MYFGDLGAAVEDFYVLGHPAVPIYLLDGPRPALFDAGLTCLAPAYLEQIDQALGGRAPAFLFLSHVHFDHCGAAAAFKETWPDLEIAASQRAAEIMLRPNARKLMLELNDLAARDRFYALESKEKAPRFQPFRVTRVLAEGDRVELGDGLWVETLATPGHTRDFLSYYVPARKILAASEAVGVRQPNGDIITEFLVDYQAYVDNMRRLDRLPVEALCQGHHWVFTGREARGFIKQSLAAAEKFRDWVLELLEETGGDIEETVRRIKAEEWDRRTGVKQEESAYLLNLAARVKHLAQTAG